MPLYQDALKFIASSVALIQAALPPDVMLAVHVQPAQGEPITLEVPAPLTGPLDCEVHCSAEDFAAILTGHLDALDALMKGRIRVEGDFGLALRLQGVAHQAA